MLISVVFVSGCIQLGEEAQPYCGDDACNGDELCSTCPIDCGTCPPICGDGLCNGDETCTSCSDDCGECSEASYCGDQTCDSDETCRNCESDCGTCPSFCGNNVCESDETCSSCPTDCGACPAKCGNSICELTEDCNNCGADCGCTGDEFCDDLGICREEVCGDDICSSDEQGSCCEDCGCPGDQICNKNTQECQEKSTADDTFITQIVNDYMQENSVTGTIESIIDAYYGDKMVKQVLIDCTQEGDPVSCSIILFIDDDGTILEEYRMG